jgi:hypothetical protein
MKRLVWLCLSLSMIAFALTGTAYAQATRTWISGVGDDANPCSRTAPCKTWAGAISKTAIGGEMDALDPGGFGTLTITKSITVDGGGGQVASILASGTNGVNVIAASTDVVILRNLRFNGLLCNTTGCTTPGIIGISLFTAARVVIENCEIFGFSTSGISVVPSSGTMNVEIQKTTINTSVEGVLVNPSGGATANVVIDGSHIDNNTGGGIKVTGTTGTTEKVAINNSSFSLNGGNGVNAVSAGSTASVDLERVTLANNGAAGVQANLTGGFDTVTVGDSLLSNNATAWNIAGGATLNSYKNNQVTGAMGSTPGTASFQ